MPVRLRITIVTDLLVAMTRFLLGETRWDSTQLRALLGELNDLALAAEPQTVGYTTVINEQAERIRQLEKQVASWRQKAWHREIAKRVG